MKFLFVGTNPENTGGATHFVALAQALIESGHEVHVVTCAGGLIAQSLAQSSASLHYAAFRNAFDARGCRDVLAVAKQVRPHWLVGNFGKEYWPLVIIGRWLRVPVALFRHRTPPMKRLSAYGIPRLATRFFAVSEYARQAYLDRGIPDALVHVLYNPVNLSKCLPDPARCCAIRHALGISDDAIVLGYAGRMHGGKGIFTLIEAATAAMAEEPRLHCLWLGDGPEAAALRARAAAGPKADRHHFLGWIHDVGSYYSAMSVLAFPSIASETFGRVSIEAQAAGVPVIASQVGGVPETLHAGVTGLLLPPGDVESWRNAITMMCNEDFRRPMAEAARPYVQERFSTKVIAEAFVRKLTS
ncbi:glycosyltransferase family 4 protein [Dyella koreensis]|uniref:Glycosyltransferase family 4 protein n=1 Tax=Dyella koreensis TaxID=311235 RepID=A0ABW8KAQ0_9GAMM